MSSARKITAERESPQGGGSRELDKRHRPFTGLFLAAPFALVTAWVLHVYLRGVHLEWHVGRYTPISWHLAGSDNAWAVTLVLLTLAAVGLSYVAWHVSDSRKLPLRVMLTASVGVAVIDFALAVAVGPARWWSFFGLIVWWGIAGMWILPRLDVTRRDPRNEEPKEQGPLARLAEKFGIGGYRISNVQRTELNGEIVRTDFDVQAAPGGTMGPMQDAVPAIESLADSSGLGAPAGMSTLTQGEGASTGHGSIIHKDILKPGVPYESPLFKPDGSRYTIDERPLTLGRAIDFEPATETFRSTQGVMGITGAGKSEYFRVKVTETSTRSWVAPVIYLDKVKGKQTAAPVLNALGAIVLSNDPTPHKAALVALERMLTYRADLFGELGYDEWEPGIIDHDGHPVPKLIAWFEECDALVPIAPGLMNYLASKARSTGIVPVYSQQRVDGEQFPTKLRGNIASWSVFGVAPNDEFSPSFALGDDVVKQGARPYWGDTKPGYYYRMERETDSSRWVVVRRVMRGSREQYWAITAEHGPRMMPLDPGTIAASQGWYEQAAAEATAIKQTMTAKGMVHVTAPDTQVKAPAAYGSADRGSESDEAFTDGDDDLSGDSYVEDSEEAMQAVEDEMREMRESGEVPANPDPGARPIDIDDPLPPVAPEDDVSWEDIGGKPAAKDRAAAKAAFYRTLVLLSQDESLRDPRDPSVTLFQVDTILSRYPFRSRPWFSEELAAHAVGESEIPAEYGLTLMVDDDDPDGHYHMHRVASVTALHAPDADAQ